MNEAFRTKLAFNLLANKNALWVRFLRSKYRCIDGVPSKLKNTNCSRLWKGLSIVWNGVRSNIIWSLGFAWNLWLARNAKIFGITGVEDGSVIIRSRHVLQLTLHNGDKRGASRFDHSHLSSATMIWSPPSGSFIKINTDAARRTSDGFARCGGVARDCSGS
ncbi:hypothetical protein V6N13_024821 [Hibiscus sabdariffa]